MAAEETVILGLQIAPETEGAPEAIAKVGDALKGLAADADEAKKALARVTPAESLNEMADWVSKTAGADAAAKLMQNMTQEGESLGAALQKTGEAAAVTAPAVASVAQETAAAVPIVEAATVVSEKATDAERAHENALKTLSSGIKEYGLQAEGARELVDGFAKQEELTAEETTGLKRDLGLLGDTTEETGKVTRGAGIAFGEMFGDMAAASKGAKESKGVLTEVAEEGTAATDIVGQAHTALRSLRIGLGATGIDPSLTAMLGQATGLMGILDVVGPALPLITNPVIIAAAASAGAFWLVHEATVGKAMRELEKTAGWEAEALAAAEKKGYVAEYKGVQITPAQLRGYEPSPYAKEMAQWQARGMIGAPPRVPGGILDKVYAAEIALQAPGLSDEEKERLALEAMRERYGEQAWAWQAYRARGAGMRPMTPQEKAERMIGEAGQARGERQLEERGRAIAEASRPDLFPEAQQRRQREREREADQARKAQEDLTAAQTAYAKEVRKQQEALGRAEAARQREVVQGQYETGQVNWQDYIDRAPAEHRPALRIQYRHWQLQQQQRMQPSRAGEGDQGGEERLLELGERVRRAEARVRGKPIPVTITNPGDFANAFKQGKRLGEVRPDF